MSFPPPPIRPDDRMTYMDTPLCRRNYSPPNTMPKPPATHATSLTTPSNDRADIYEALTALDDALDAVSVNSSSGVHSTCSSLCSSSGTGGGASLSNYGSDTPTGTTATPATLRKPIRADYACVLDSKRTHSRTVPPATSTIPPPPSFAAPTAYVPPTIDTTSAIDASLPSPPAYRQPPPTLPKTTPISTNIEPHATPPLSSKHNS